MKQRINNQILQSVKETAVDCNLYSGQKSSGKNDGEQLVCYGFGKVESNQFASYPSLERDQGEKEGLDVNKVFWRGVNIKIAGVDYALNESTNDLYDFESYQRAKQLGTEPILVGKLVVEKGRARIER